MDPKIVFVRTKKGDDEINSTTSYLYGDVKRVLVLIDEQSTVKELRKRAAPSLRAEMDMLFQELLTGGFIQDQNAVSNSAAPNMSSPVKISNPKPSMPKEGDEPSLDFTGSVTAQIPPIAISLETISIDAEKEALKARLENQRKEEKIPSIAIPLETISIDAEKKALKARLENQRNEEQKMAAAAAALLKAEQEAAARLRAAQEAEAARLKAEQEAARIKAAAHEAEMARIKIEAEMKARAAQEAEQAAQKAREEERARIQAEAALVRAREAAEAQARAKLEAEQAQIAARAIQEAQAAAEAARLKAEQEAARIKAAAHEAEMARIKIEAEMKARAAQEAEQAEQKAREEERARIQTEAALARARMAEEAQARAKLEAEQAAARVIQEARVAAEEEAKARVAEEVRLQAEEEAKAKVAKKVKLQAEEQAKAKVAKKVKLQAEKSSKKSRVEAGGVSLGTELSGATDRLMQGKEDGQTQKLVEAQAKVWSEAEQRTKAQTQVAQTQQAVVPPPPVQRVPRSPRKPLPVVKVSLMLIISVVGAIFLLPYMLPMEEYIKQAELTLSTQLKQPVKIGAMRANLLPMPTLELQNVEMGNPIQAQVESVVLNFNLLTVFSPVKEIAKVEVNDVVINANFFSAVMPLFAAAGRDALYPVQRMVLQGVNIKGFAPQGDKELPSTNGVLDFNSQGELVKVVLDTEDKIIRVQLQPVEKFGQGNWKFGLLLRDGHLPLLPEILFTELNVAGLVSLSEANINEIEGFLYGGKLTGSTRVTWAKGWQMLGQLHLSNLELQEAMPQLGVMGKLDGDASLNFRAGSLAHLIQSPQMHAPQMTGKFVVKKGAINAFDLVDVISGNAAGSGRTHFDEANGTWQVANDSYQLRQIKIAGGMMSANGLIDLSADKKLSGKLDVALQAREEMGNVSVLLTGTLAKPQLQVGAN